MLCMLVLDWVYGEVDSADVVVVDKCTLAERVMELPKEMAELARLSNAIGDSAVHNLVLERWTMSCCLED